MRRTKRRDPSGNIKGYLATQPADALIELLLEVAERDDRFFDSLLLKAQTPSGAGGGGNVVKSFRRVIDNATQVHGFVHWREVGTFAAHIDQVADSLAELLKPDSAATVIELAEYAIERVEGALEQVDDSNGEIGDIVCRLGELHYKACTMSRPEPAALAQRLFRLETTLPFSLCSFDADTYRNVLGKPGLQKYQRSSRIQVGRLRG
jgi:hypothetical protein